MSKKILILGCNGFIGSNLIETILTTTDWDIYGFDLYGNNIQKFLSHPKLHFTEGDMTIHKEWIEYHIKKCDVILPLAAIATPATYVQDPIRVFELDFVANLDILRKCVRYQKRIIFPSTSEVYGMCTDPAFDEETSPLVLGPINKQRWIYSCSKQLLDRVIFAFGDKENLEFSLFRPFNWIGPKQDNIFNKKPGGSRVLIQFIGNILRGEDIQLVDGGSQRRCFTFINDGIDALVKIIANTDYQAAGRIFNIGNPYSDHSIRELAELALVNCQQHTDAFPLAKQVKLLDISSDTYYGKGYQDVQLRVPKVENAKQYLDWEPTTDFKTAIAKTVAYYAAEINAQAKATTEAV